MNTEPLTLNALKQFMQSVPLGDFDQASYHVISKTDNGIKPAFCVLFNPTVYQIEIYFYPKVSHRLSTSLSMKLKTTPQYIEKKIVLNYTSKTTLTKIIHDYNVLAGLKDDKTRLSALIKIILESLQSSILENTPIDKTTLVFLDFNKHKKAIENHIRIKGSVDNDSFVHTYLTDHIFSESEFPIKSEINVFPEIEKVMEREMA